MVSAAPHAPRGPDSAAHHAGSAASEGSDEGIAMYASGMQNYKYKDEEMTPQM